MIFVMEEARAVCTKCGIDKPLSDFGKKSAAKSGYRNSCKACYSAYMRIYWKDNPDQYDKHKVRANKFRPAYSRHGLTKNQFDDMLNKRDGLCWSCGVNPATNIDHDHKHCPGPFGCSKCIRGILCHHCNTALGLLGDNASNINNLSRYLDASGDIPSIL